MNISDLKLFKSSVISDLDTNGGYLSYNQVVSDVLNNVFPNVTYSERTNGVKRYRKLFLKNANSANELLSNAHVGIVNPSLADDIYYIFSGTQSDTQADVKDGATGDPVAGTKLLGGGTLVSDVNVGATVINVLFEDSTYDIASGDKVLITNKLDPAGTGVEEYATVSSVTWSGNEASITLAQGINGSYVATDPTYVCVMLSLGDIQASYTIDSTTTSAGTYDDSGNPILVDNQGTIDEIWTITFTSATTFACTASINNITSNGDVASSFTINNPNTVTPYFTIQSGFWTGTWAAGDTLTFSTISSSKGFWLLEDVPNGASTYSNNSISLRIYGE